MKTDIASFFYNGKSTGNQFKVHQNSMLPLDTEEYRADMQGWPWRGRRDISLNEKGTQVLAQHVGGGGGRFAHY